MPPTVRKRVRFQDEHPLEDEVEKGAVENVDEADAGSQQLVGLVAPVVDQIEEEDSDQVMDGSIILRCFHSPYQMHYLNDVLIQ